MKMHPARLFPKLLIVSMGVAHAQPPSPESSSVPTELPQVTVIGVKGETDRVTGSAHRVDAQTLEAFHYDDINRVLNFVPGVYVREEDGFGLRPNIGLRGASSDRSQKVTLMEDGVLIGPAPYSAPAAYFFPLTTRMVGVEVFKGPASIQHGPQTIGGAVNLLSAPIPDDPQMQANAAAGAYGYRRLHLRGGDSWQGGGAMAEYVHLASDGFKRLDGGGDTGFAKNEWLAKAAWDIGPGRLSLRAGYADEVSDETYLGLTESDFRADATRRYRASALDRMEWDWAGGRVGWLQPLLGGSLQLTAYAQDFQRAWRKFNDFAGADIREVLANPQTPFNQPFVNVLRGADTDGLAGTPDDLRIGTNDRSFAVRGLQGKLSWEFGSDLTHLLETGARLHYDRIQRLHDEFGFEQIDGELVDNGLPRSILTDNEAHSTALALWLRDEISAGRWTFVPGLRTESIAATLEDHLSDRANTHRYTVVLPGFGLSYELAPGWRALAGVHRGFAPAAPDADVDNDPEKSVNYEAGLRVAQRAGRFEAIGFFNDYSNLTAICTVSSGCSPDQLDTQTSAGKVSTYGLEAGWNKSFAWASSGLSMPIALTYTFTRSRFDESFVSSDPQFGTVEAGFELPYVPRHRANLMLGLAGADWGVDLSASYQSRMRDRAGRGHYSVSEGSDSFLVLDLAARHSFTPSLAIEGRIDNLLDERYVVSRRPYGARPGIVRVFQLGLSYRY